MGIAAAIWGSDATADWRVGSGAGGKGRVGAAVCRIGKATIRDVPDESDRGEAAGQCQARAIRRSIVNDDNVVLLHTTVEQRRNGIH
ncbi:MAG: hypothetical protein NVS4B8_20870 [Herpetosiphon sp.]